jgi:hypothetical protein
MNSHELAELLLLLFHFILTCVSFICGLFPHCTSQPFTIVLLLLLLLLLLILLLLLLLLLLLHLLPYVF